jgi:hypothetical protein
MAGLGSGRRSGLGRETVEDYCSIDLNRLHKAGCLRPGRSGGWQWTRHREKVASITLPHTAAIQCPASRRRLPSARERDLEARPAPPKLTNARMRIPV